MYKITSLLLATGFFFASSEVEAKEFNHELTVSPFFGGGRLSTGDSVEYSSGIKATYHYPFKVGRYALGPMFEAGNSYVKAKRRSGGRRTLSTYDNRYFSGGLRAGRLFGDSMFPHAAYFSSGLGRAYTKLVEDESGPQYYSERQYHGLEGYYLTSELGLDYRLRKNLSINFALLGFYYKTDQSKAKGTEEKQESVDEGLRFTASETDAEEGKLDNSVLQQAGAASVGFRFSF